MAGGDMSGYDVPVVPDATLSASEQERVRSLVMRARDICGLCVGVYVGPLVHGRESALAQHAALPDPAGGFLVAVDVEARAIEIVTGIDAARVLDNRSCELAILSMTSCFVANDIMSGIREGVLLLAEHARTPRVWHLDDPD